MTPRWEIQRWLKHCKGELRWACTFVYSSKILEYLLWSAFEYQKYDLKHSTQKVSTKSTASNTVLKIWVLKVWHRIRSTQELGKYSQKYSSLEYGLSMTSNTLLKIWVSKVWPQILYSNFEYKKYNIKYSAQGFEYWKYDFSKLLSIELLYSTDP